jgi:hypothetical protein
MDELEHLDVVAYACGTALTSLSAGRQDPPPRKAAASLKILDVQQRGGPEKAMSNRHERGTPWPTGCKSNLQEKQQRQGNAR